MRSYEEESRMDQVAQMVTAARRCFSIDKLIEFAQSDHAQVRRSAMCNPRITREILELALRDTDIPVRRKVASNRNSDEKILLLALKDKNLMVACAAAINPSASKKVIEKALRSKEQAIRSCAITNPSISPISLMIPLDDEDSVNAQLAAKMLYKRLTEMGFIDEQDEDSWAQGVIKDPIMRLSIKAKVASSKDKK